jgi:hypothetical protein
MTKDQLMSDPETKYLFPLFIELAFNRGPTERETQERE